MARGGKDRYDSGRAKTTRARDRAQMFIDDELINAFLSEDEEDQPFRRPIPVHRGSGRLGDPLSDSALAMAVLNSGDLSDDEPDRFDETALETELDFPESLFDGWSDDLPVDSSSPASHPPVEAPICDEGKHASQPVKPVRQDKPAPVCRPVVVPRAATAAAVRPRFDLSRLIRGMIVGAGIALSAVIVLRLVR